MVIYKKRFVLVVCIVILLLLSVLGIWLKCSGRLDAWLMERKYKSSLPNCNCANVLSQKEGRYYSPTSVEELYDNLEKGIELGYYTREDMDVYLKECLFKCEHGFYFVIESETERQERIKAGKDFLARFSNEWLRFSDDYRTVYIYATREDCQYKTNEFKKYYWVILASSFSLQQANNIQVWDKELNIHWIDSVTGETIHTEKGVSEVQSNLDWDVPYDSFSSAQ